MAINRYKFFGAQDSARLSKLHLSARQVVEGVITGMHKSPHQGFSVEFSEHREYVPGDELRHMDWRAYARSDRHYIKLYEQETNLRATIVLDVSASMKFGDKLDYARHIAACLAYLLASQQDLVGLVSMDDKVKDQLPAASSPAHLDRLFRTLDAMQPGEQTQLPKLLHSLVEQLPRRSLVIVISDLWVDRQELSQALQHLRYRKHQGMLLHLIHPDEMELPYSRQVTLEDLETGQRLAVNADDLRETYRKQVAEHLSGIRRCCGDSDVEYHAIKTSQPYDKALIHLLGRRGK